ncbi:MAG TPA: transposase family protein, partial [Clostridiales bacterium]|nr:transposase family protein [Clostridiales bacterium]
MDVKVQAGRRSCHKRWKKTCWPRCSTFGQKLYLSPILDLCSRDIVSYTISERPVLSMVISILDKAFARIPDGTNLILYSDQGWQYQHKQYQKMLRRKGIR